MEWPYGLALGSINKLRRLGTVINSCAAGSLVRLKRAYRNIESKWRVTTERVMLVILAPLRPGHHLAVMRRR